MPRLIINIPCDGERAELKIYREDEDIVFSVEPYDQEADPAVGSEAHLPLDQFRSMFDKLVSD